MRYSHKLNLEISVDILNICDIHRNPVRYLECIQSQMKNSTSDTPSEPVAGFHLDIANSFLQLHLEIQVGLGYSRLAAAVSKTTFLRLTRRLRVSLALSGPLTVRCSEPRQL